jgi:ABC-type oligopeptide transport system substrate-binding subunit
LRHAIDLAVNRTQIVNTVFLGQASRSRRTGYTRER